MQMHANTNKTQSKQKHSKHKQMMKEAAEAASIHEFCNAEKKKNEDATKKNTQTTPI